MKGEAEGAPTAGNSRSGLFGRLGDVLGTPVALAASVVALVTLVGGVSTWTATRALRMQGELRAESDLRERAEDLSTMLELALRAADPLLRRLESFLRELDPHVSPRILLTRMYATATARPGLARLSITLPDGTYLGVRRDQDGSLFAEEIHWDGVPAHERGRLDVLRPDTDGHLVRVQRGPTDYDARKRGFYALAIERGQAVWTPPYAFLPHRKTGLTRAEPVFVESGGQHRLEAVLTADFDTGGFAELLDQPLTPSERQLIISGSQSVLAVSGTSLPPITDPERERPIRWDELHDLPLERARATAGGRGALMRRFYADGEAWRLSQTQVAQLDDIPILFVSALPEAELFAEARAITLRGTFTTLGTALLGLALALVLSRRIAQLKRQRAAAQKAEQQARKELAELGSYELIAPLSKGGMAEVYRARHRLLTREAALKLIRVDGEPSEEERERFFAEARALAGLHSVHTVDVYDFGIAADGREFLAMELLDGCDLQRLVERYGPQPPARVASILAQICQSLSEAHGLGLVHRDLKPSNVFLCRQAEWLDLVKVLDFGLTRRIGESDGARVSGTPAYMAPEQALGRSVGPSADLYATGCVGFFLLTGKPPYEATSAGALMHAHVHDPVPRLPQVVRAHTPAALVQLVTRCLAKDPAHRPTSADTLERALSQVVAQCADTFTGDMCRAFWDALPRPSLAEPATREHVHLSVLTHAEPRSEIRSLSLPATGHAIATAWPE